MKGAHRKLTYWLHNFDGVNTGEKRKTCVIRKQNRSTVNTPALPNVTTQHLGDKIHEE
jgi:hypothetical protein